MDLSDVDTDNIKICDNIVIKWKLDVAGGNLVKKAMKIGNFLAILANYTKDMLVFWGEFLRLH